MSWQIGPFVGTKRAVIDAVEKHRHTNEQARLVKECILGTLKYGSVADYYNKQAPAGMIRVEAHGHYIAADQDHGERHGNAGVTIEHIPVLDEPIAPVAALAAEPSEA